MAINPTSDAPTAWKELSTAAGLEPGGRDLDLVERLRVTLDPAAASLTAALVNRTAKELLQAFFDTQQDFVAMLRGVLAFYEAAGAKWGKQQWRLDVDGTALGLEHFTEFLSTWNSIPHQFDVPAIDRRGSRAIVAAAADTLSRVAHEGTMYSGDDASDDWLEAAAQGDYAPLPTDWPCAGLPAAVADGAALTLVAVNTIRRMWKNRGEMLAEHRARGYASDEQDGLSPRTIAQEETDDLLCANVRILGQCAALPAPDLAAFAANLAERYAAYPRRYIGMLVDQSRLDTILSLPVWQKRHALYAVWIGAELVRAMEDHAVQLHHDEGTIRFGFAKTLLATVHSTEPKMRLYAERRTSLDEPVGSGRVAGVQPDFTLWRGMENADHCKLVVEVKHYKRNAPQSFAEAMVDYARAHPFAKVVLVNHGKAKVTIAEEYDDESKRSATIGELTASNLARREELRDYVQAAVGDRMFFGTLPEPGGGCVVLDVSGSMRDAVRARQMPDFLDRLADTASPDLALVDCEVRIRAPLRELASHLQMGHYYQRTDLEQPLHALLEDFDELLLVTDEAGEKDVSAMASLAVERMVPQYLSWMTLYVVRVRRAGPAQQG